MRYRWVLMAALTFGGLVNGIVLAADPDASLHTLAETTHYQRTGRYDEVERLCHAFAARWPQQVKCIEFGRTPESRPMLALVASADGTLTAEAAKTKHRPVMLFQGGIHAGEIDGKDAGFAFLRGVLEGRTDKGALNNVTLVFVPVFNIDGHERFGRWNRPNQIGPEEMGWRTTAQNFNLNRDYMKADAPEMHAMLGLLNVWDPILYIDLHVTDGAQFQHDISVMIEPRLVGDAGLKTAGAVMSTTVMKDLARAGSKPLEFYAAFNKDDDPASGFADNVVPPRFSQDFWAQHNRFGVLVETHSWKDYATRVRITRNTLVSLLSQASSEGTHWLELADQADKHAAAIAGKPVTLSYDTTEHSHLIDFQGYAYTRDTSAISGAPVVRYDPSKPQVWHIPLKDEVIATLTVPAPKAGYVVPAAQAQWVAAKLTLHGVQFSVIDHVISKQSVQTFRTTKVKWASESFEGHLMPTLEGAWNNEQRDIPSGSLFVPIAQPRSLLVMDLLEPQAADSFASWGFFNTAFEPKEYMEPYVTEDVAKKMLANDSQLRAQFEQRLKDDKGFAKDPAARLDFFYRRHPSYDERLNLYPVYRTDAVP